MKTMSILTLIGLTLLISCSKEKNYRKKLVGNYVFTRNISSHSYYDNPMNYSWSIIDTGKIEIFKGYDGNNDDIRHKIGILFNLNSSSYIYSQSCYKDLTFGEGNYIHPTVDKKGNITYPEYECNIWGHDSHFSGTIKDNAIELNYWVGDATFQTSHHVVGQKI